MILADTSIWIGHLRHGNKELVDRLRSEQILMHPLVIGEIAAGSLKDRTELRARLQRLPRAISARDYLVLQMIEAHKLYGLGLSFFDLHLLASARLTPEARLWSTDKALAAAAQRLGVAFE